MTKKLFDLDSYITCCDAQVLSCQPAKKNGISGFAVELDQTCFFPEGGGQPADTGSIRVGDTSVQVLYTYEQDERIFHLCDGELAVGAAAHAVLNFEGRFANMQIHSGEHILSGTILRVFGLHNVGFHMGHEINTIDLDGEISPEQAHQLEAQVNDIICQNRPVFVSYPNPQELAQIPLRKKPEVDHLRVVVIEDCDWCGCCGTHVARTGEIGFLRITDVQRYKGGTRMSFLCGRAAVEDAFVRCQSLKQICASLSCKPQEALTNVEKLKAELSEKKQALAAKNKQLFSLMAEQLAAQAEPFGSDRLVLLRDDSLSADELKVFAAQLSQHPGIVGALFTRQGDTLSYALCRCADTACDLRALNQHLGKTLSGKGGGNQELCCGRLPICEEAELRSCILSLIG